MQNKRDEGKAGKINCENEYKKKFLASKATIILEDSDNDTPKNIHI